MNLAIFPLFAFKLGFCLYLDGAYTSQGKQFVPELLLKLSDTFTSNKDILSMCMKCHAKKYFWQSDSLSNLAILYGLCILDSSFLYLTITVQGYLIGFVLFFYFI